MKKIELLVPAGDKNCFFAAINNGADAIYIGGKNFSARAFASNFTDEELIECIKYAHIRGVKVHVCINTAIYDEEINKILEYIDFLYLNDVDALIVADFGLLSIIKERYSDLDVHVSTQFNTHNLWQIKLLESLKVNRVVLARETSLKTIKFLKENSTLDLEIFAHGAMCVCYSGNCLHSSMIGKRSGNRGKCAQPCRMEYNLMEDNKIISSKKYILSMKDLNVLEHIGDIIEANITSIKIEGRMKNVEYVSLVTKAYREAIDRYYESKDKSLDITMLEKLKLTYSRSFTKGYLFNEQNKELTNTFRPNNIGIMIGKVVGFANKRVKIKLSEDVFQQDKIVILQPKEDIGFYLSKIYVKNKLVSQGYKDEIIELDIHSNVILDSLVYKVVDHKLQEQIAKDNSTDKYRHIPIRMKFMANVGEYLALSVKDYNNHSVIVKSEYKVEKALNSPTSEAKISEQLSKVKSTCYEITLLDIKSDNLGIIPVKFINDLRREALLKLDEARSNTYHREKENLKEIELQRSYNKINKCKLKVKVYNIYQLQAIEKLKEIDEIYYADLSTYNLVCKTYPKLNIIPVLPRISEDRKEEDIDTNHYVVSQYGDLLKYQNSRLTTDLYMNVCNLYSIAKLIQMGVETITISPELSKTQIRNLIANLKANDQMPQSLEMVVYGRYQTMITNYCMIAKEFNYNRKNCGTCKNRHFALLDRMNYKFPIITDKNCKVTILNSKALHLIDYLEEIKEMGINSIRLDFSVESPQEVKSICEAYINMNEQKQYDFYLKDVTYGYYLDD